MKTTSPIPLVALWLLLVACQSPVTNVTTVTSGGSLPLGQGHTVYVASGDGYGVLVYPSGATNWTSSNWSAYYSSKNSTTYYNYSAGQVYPPVYDVTVDSSTSTIYAATEAGLFVGSGSSWTRYLSGVKVNSVAISGSQVFVSTHNGLKTVATSNLAFISNPSADMGVVDKSSDGVVLQWRLAGTTAYAATPSGLFSTSTPTNSSSYLTPGALVVGRYPFAGFINSLSYASSSGTLYIGTPLGYSTFDGTTWTDVAASGFTAPVNGILVGTLKTYMATSGGLSFGTPGSWTTITTSRPVKNVVLGANSTTLYAANSYTGLLIITTDASGVPQSKDTVLAGLDVAKVYVTVP